MRHAAKIDANQEEIVRLLRQCGCSVQSLASVGNGCPDLLVGRQGRNWLLEVKDGSRIPSQQRLTPLQAVWHEAWRGQVVTVRSRDEVAKALGLSHTPF